MPEREGPALTTKTGNRVSIPRVVIAGLRGGTGKTTLSVGLAAALVQRGLNVTPFKKGPDYIDAGWLALAARGPCYNLDPFLIGERRVLASFSEHSAGAGFAVIEGNRGLFDGMDPDGSYSTARVARILRAPVVLIVDCTKTTRTMAAMVLGARKFERGITIGGVVLNMTAGQRHEAVTREAVERQAGVPVLGAIPRLRAPELPERHMGLIPWQEHPEMEEAVRRAAELIEKYVDIKRLLRIARAAPHLGRRPLPARGSRKTGGPRIGVIRDSAFQFYYPENIEELEKRGAEIVYLSALERKAMPSLDALYIGGGFPETHAIVLSKNSPFLRALKEEVEEGLPVYAECGGLMYLGKSIILKGKSYPMAGVFPVSFTLHARPRAHGYTVVRAARTNPFYRKGTELRGHEFHYSAVDDPAGLTGDFPMALRVKRGEGIYRGMDGLCYKNVFATYTHVHALGAPEWADGMVEAAGAFARQRGKRP